MKRFRMLSLFFLLGAVSVAGALLPRRAQAQISTHGTDCQTNGA